jgi:head-tail adaptor
MTTKNPYEIRLELLRMAKEMMDTAYNDSMSAWWSLASSYAEAQNKSVEEFIKQSEELMKTKPVMYAPSAITAKAQELYGFVAKKD